MVNAYIFIAICLYYAEVYYSAKHRSEQKEQNPSINSLVMLFNWQPEVSLPFPASAGNATFGKSKYAATDAVQTY